MLEIRSKYILKNILSFLSQKKFLSLIKYNKKIQNKLDKSIIDYREYNQIEIEITPIKNNFSGKVINFKEENKEYYYIYFDNQIKEINYVSSKDNISKIKIIIDFEIKSLEGLFEKCDYISMISFHKFNRKDINNISCMFKRCSNLISINFSKFNTSKVINMNFLFYNCSSLKELNLSNFNTSIVSNMEFMFYNCSSLKELDLSNFNTSKVTNMDSMFGGCSSLKELNLSNFKTSKVTNMDSMFFNCSSLNELNLSNFKTSKVTNMSYMFYNCSSLKELNLSKFNIKDNTNVDYMFSGCSDDLKNKIRNQNKGIKENAFKDEKNFDVESEELFPLNFLNAELLNQFNFYEDL